MINKIINKKINKPNQNIGRLSQWIFKQVNESMIARQWYRNLFNN